MRLLTIYFVAYSVITLLFIWYKYMMKFITKKISYGLYETSYSVVIPVFNEKPALFRKCLKSVFKADGKKEIFVVDDGSKPENRTAYKQISKEFKVKYIQLAANEGKRAAQYRAFKLVKNEIIVTIDSDTLINKNSLIELSKPFNDENVGATTGNVRVYNRNKNLLTRIIDARYYNAFEFERASQSAFGIVSCCSGVISAYRKTIIKEVMDRYLNQQFLGKTCTYGDDRHLTSLILRNHKVVFTKNAMAYTEAPESLYVLIKQQIRWKCSFIRENILALQYVFKRSKILAFETIYESTIPLFSLLVRLSVIFYLIKLPLLIIYYSASILFMALIRNLEALFKKEFKLVVYNSCYGFLQMFVIYWLYFVALYKLFIVSETKWLTR